MRLICPNCGAQYEVPDEVIPQDGRDVQCSNCGDTWFQKHSSNDDALSEEPDAPMPAEISATQEVSEPEKVPEREPDPEPESSEEEADEAEPAAVEAKPSRDIDPAVADILKQEAEHEANLRATEGASGLETQPELGLQEAEDDATRRSREARERMARMRGQVADDPDPAEAAATAALGSRRDLLPDIEEINSSLRSASDRQADVDDGEGYAEAEISRQRGGFRRGFTLTILMAVILAVIYILAPKISQTVPQAEPALTSYVVLVDNGRVVLDGYVATLLEWLDAKASGSASE